MQGIYPYGSSIALGYLLLAIIAIEARLDPWLKRVRYLLIVLDVLACVWFSIAVTFSTAPLDLNAYVVPSDYQSGTSIGGIRWHPNLTELRLTITNPSSEDYRDLDIVIQPDKWTHSAAILGDAAGCFVLSVGGNAISSTIAGKSGKLTMSATRAGSKFDTYDNLGNVYTTAATDGGHRLRCSEFPSGFTILIVFALVTLPPSDLLPMPPSAPVGGMSIAASELAGVKNILDVFGKKPFPHKIVLTGKYTKGIKPHTLSRLPLQIGNRQ
jgi:hypothetical protein